MTHPLRTSPERRLDDRQLASVRSEMHRLVDQVLDALPVIQRQESEWGRGYPSSTTGGGGGGSDSSSTERAALDPHDPAAACAEWRLLFDESLGSLRNTAHRATRLLPLTDAQISHAQIRQNTVDICAECGERAPDRVKRLDGVAYHAERCFWQAYNRIRGRRGA